MGFLLKFYIDRIKIKLKIDFLWNSFFLLFFTLNIKNLLSLPTLTAYISKITSDLPNTRFGFGRIRNFEPGRPL